LQLHLIDNLTVATSYVISTPKFLQIRNRHCDSSKHMAG